MRETFKAYHVAVIRLGQGITSAEAYQCWRRGLAVDAVALAVLEMRRIGMSRGPVVRKHRPVFGPFDTRSNPAVDGRKTKRPKLEPKWLRDIPQGGYPGLQEQLKAQRANPDALDLPPKVARLEAKLNAQIAKTKDWEDFS